MGIYFKGMEFDRNRSTLLIHLNADQLRREPEMLQTFIEELELECRRRLPFQLMRDQTHREYMSDRIKLGIRRAQERRAIGL